MRDSLTSALSLLQACMYCSSLPAHSAFYCRMPSGIPTTLSTKCLALLRASSSMNGFKWTRPDRLHCSFLAKCSQVAAAVAVCEPHQVLQVRPGQPARLALQGVLQQSLSAGSIRHGHVNPLHEPPPAATIPSASS